MVIERRSKDTLTALELDVGDELRFELASGTVRRIVVKHASATVTRRGIIANGSGEGVLTYRIECALHIDGLRVVFVRDVPSAGNFAPPASVMGLHIWIDAVDDIFSFLTETHGQCRPKKKLRFAIWEAGQRICPVLLHPWCPLPPNGLSVDRCYRGEDVWLGPYDGNSAHGGLDINHPPGTPLWTPFAIDEHGFFDRLGANNNRWRGLHRWANGATWVIQAHHLIRLLVPEDRPIEAGVHYAESAGVLAGAVNHTHFVLRVRDGNEEVMLDPWLLFWQMYEDRRQTVESA